MEGKIRFVNKVKEYTTREYAAKVGRDPSTIRRWIYSGKISARKHGRDWMIPEVQDIDAAITLETGDHRRDAVAYVDSADIIRKMPKWDDIEEIPYD